MNTFTFYLINIILYLSTNVRGLDVPTKMADKPLMDPKPKLPDVTAEVFLNISIDGRFAGKIIIGLFGKVAPITVDNFIGLCKCNKGIGKLSGKPLCYKGTKIHRIMPNFMIQSGDFTHGNGVGGESIYGGRFKDETFELKHNKRHLVSMANHGPNSNGSQFFINTVKTSWLDNKNVVFGMVLEGFDIVDKLERLGTNSGIPRSEVIISDCGEVVD